MQILFPYVTGPVERLGTDIGKNNVFLDSQMFYSYVDGSLRFSIPQKT